MLRQHTTSQALRKVECITSVADGSVGEDGAGEDGAGEDVHEGEPRKMEERRWRGLVEERRCRWRTTNAGQHEQLGRRRSRCAHAKP
jgi:hypothetical protein